MTAIIDSRPRIPRLAMVFIAAVVVMLLTAPKAGAWTATEGDFKIEKPYSSYGSTEVTVKEYTGNDTNITLPSTVTYSGTEYNVTAVGSNVLKKLAGTEGIDLTVNIPEGYTTIAGNAFQNCYGLKTITIPGSVTAINYNAFDGCKNLASVNFAASTQSKLTFGIKTFLGCTALNHLELPARVTSVDAGSFQGCTSLTDLSVASDAYFVQDGTLYKKNEDGKGYTLHTYAPASTETSYTVPDTVNGLPVTSIFRMAFQNNANLTSVTVPASVTSFKSYAFDSCAKLMKISIAADSVTLDRTSSGSFTNLPEGSVIEVANETVKNAFESTDAHITYYTAGKTTVRVKSNEPEPEATPAAALTLKGTGVKDGYSYYKLTLDSAANVSTMIVNLSFDASQVSKDAQVKLNDNRFMIPTQTWKEEGGRVKVSILLTPADNRAITAEGASDLLLLGLPVKANVTGNLTATVDSAECAGVVSEVSTKGTVTVNGSPASNRITSYDVNADSVIDILDITEAQRFYQASQSDADWATAQKADVNADGQVDIQDLIDIFLQIEF